MIVTIHQPNFLPYLGFFDKILKSEIYVVYDSAQYVKENFINRNRINNNGHELIITIPVNNKSWHNSIRETEYSININKEYLKKKQLKLINSIYNKSPFFDKYYKILNDMYDIYVKSNNLVDINIFFIKKILELFGWTGKIIYSSELDIQSNDSTEKLVEIIKKTGGTTYLCGNSGKNYMNIELFDKNDIKILYQNFTHPEYCIDNKDKFIMYMSILDYLFYNDNDISIFNKNYNIFYDNNINLYN